MRTIIYNVWLNHKRIGSIMIRYGNYIEQVIINNDYSMVIGSPFVHAVELIYEHAAQMIDRFHRKFPQVKLWQKLQHQPHCD